MADLDAATPLYSNPSNGDDRSDCAPNGSSNVPLIVSYDTLVSSHEPAASEEEKQLAATKQKRWLAVVFLNVAVQMFMAVGIVTSVFYVDELRFTSILVIQIQHILFLAFLTMLLIGMRAALHRPSVVCVMLQVFTLCQAYLFVIVSEYWSFRAVLVMLLTPAWLSLFFCVLTCQVCVFNRWLATVLSVTAISMASTAAHIYVYSSYLSLMDMLTAYVFGATYFPFIVLSTAYIIPRADDVGSKSTISHLASPSVGVAVILLDVYMITFAFYTLNVLKACANGQSIWDVHYYSDLDPVQTELKVMVKQSAPEESCMNSRERSIEVSV